jgi:hypothetical protein
MSSNCNNNRGGCVRIGTVAPNEYRLAKKPDGELVLQGGCRWSCTTCASGGIEWRDIPTFIMSVPEENNPVVTIDGTQAEYTLDGNIITII